MHGPKNYAFIDGVNLHLTYENLHWKLDYKKLKEYLETKFNVITAYYFLGNIPNKKDIHLGLESDGYILKLKDPTSWVTPEEYCPYCWKAIAPEIYKYKSDCDSFLTLQVMKDLSDFDKAVLITSDGDFDNLVKFLLLKDKLNIVFAPCRDGCSSLLIKAARGRIAFIDDYKSVLEKTNGENLMGI